MSLYNFVTQNKNRFMRALIERNKKAPQQFYSRFMFADNPDINQSTMGLCAQGNMQKNMKEDKEKEEAQPDSLVSKIQDIGQSIGRKTLTIGKNFLEKIGYKVQDNQPVQDSQHKDDYEAWAGLFCRDLKELEGIEAAIKTEGWKEVKDSKKIERYKGIGHMFYEYEVYVLALFYSQQGMNIATMIYKRTGQFTAKEFYHQLNTMMDWMISALKPSQEIKAPEKIPEPIPEKVPEPVRIPEKPAKPEVYKSKADKTPELEQIVYESNEVEIDDNHQGTFAIVEKKGQIKAGLMMGNIPELSDDIINRYVTEMKDQGYSAAVDKGRLVIAKRLQQRPSEMERIEIEMAMVNYAAEFVKLMEGS